MQPRETEPGQEARDEMRLKSLERLVPLPSFNCTNSSPISARAATQQQFVIDALDVWIPATGAELVKVNEGMLGILGFVMLLALSV